MLARTPANIMSKEASDNLLQEHGIPLHLRNASCIVIAVKDIHSCSVNYFEGGSLPDTYLGEIVDEDDTPLFSDMHDDCCGLAMGKDSNTLVRHILPPRDADVLIKRFPGKSPSSMSACCMLAIPYDAFEVPMHAAGDEFVLHVRRILETGVAEWFFCHIWDDNQHTVDHLLEFLKIKVRYTQDNPKLSLYESGMMPWCVNICVAMWGAEVEEEMYINGKSHRAFLPEHEIYLPMDTKAITALCANMDAVLLEKSGQNWDYFDNLMMNGSVLFRAVADKCRRHALDLDAAHEDEES